MLHLTYHRATRTPTINFQNASCAKTFALGKAQKFVVFSIMKK